MVSNIYEATIEGQKVGFKCGTLAIAIACREAGCKTIQELFAKMAEQDLLAILALFYGSACQYSGKKAPELTMDIVSDWIEAMGEEQAQKATLVMLEMFKPKNAPAPKKGAKR
jgi:hypothetical protein